MCRETVTEVTVQMAATNLADDGEANPFGALMPPHGAPAQDPNFIMPLPWEGADGTHVPVPSPTLSASRSPSSTPVASSSASAWAAGHDHAPPASPAAAHGSFVVFGIDSGAKIDFDADMDALIRRGRVRPGTRHVRRGPVVAAATATATATAPVAAGSEPPRKRSRKLFRLSDASGQLEFQLVGDDGVEGGETISREDLVGDDVFLLDDAGKTIWVWEGSRASTAEKAMWLRVAQAYVRKLQKGEDGAAAGDVYLTPIAKVREGNESAAFLRAVQVM